MFYDDILEILDCYDDPPEMMGGAQKTIDHKEPTIPRDSIAVVDSLRGIWRAIVKVTLKLLKAFHMPHGLTEMVEPRAPSGVKSKFGRESSGVFKSTEYRESHISEHN